MDKRALVTARALTLTAEEQAQVAGRLLLVSGDTINPAEQLFNSLGTAAFNTLREQLNEHWNALLLKQEEQRVINSDFDPW